MLLGYSLGIRQQPLRTHPLKRLSLHIMAEMFEHEAITASKSGMELYGLPGPSSR